MRRQALAAVLLVVAGCAGETKDTALSIDVSKCFERALDTQCADTLAAE